MEYLDKIDYLKKRAEQILPDFFLNQVKKVPLESYFTKIPFVQKKMEEENEKIISSLEKDFFPYQDKYHVHSKIPNMGHSQEEILSEMNEISEQESEKWQDGYVSGTVYNGDKKHVNFMNQVYSINSQVNPLHGDIWPSAQKYESEVVAMTAQMLGADAVRNRTVCGSVSSGGTESILLAVKAYRDQALEEKGIKKPEMILPNTAHPAFDKAAHYFQIRKKVIPTDKNFCAEMKMIKKAMSKKTILIVGSAPSFPHGTMDPIKEMSDFALQHNIGFHTDACLGGFVLPWIEDRYKLEPYDFRLPGVTSISVDTHKFGYANKGSSVILYRHKNIKSYQYHISTEWPGGLYFSPTFAGSRSGAVISQCWASMVHMGVKGYRKRAHEILDTSEYIISEIKKIPQLHLLGNPLWIIAFGSNKLNIYEIMDQMTKRNWNLNGLHKPSCLHLCVTLRHTKKNVAQKFIHDLKESVSYVENNPGSKDGLAPVYGLGASLPIRGAVRNMLKSYLDLSAQLPPQRKK